jgi:hypothetical protein
MADPQKEAERKGVANFKAGLEADGSPEEMEQLVVTINPAVRRIVKVEKVDKAGTHHELSSEECAKLVGQDEVEEIEAALEEAFEAGVDGVLGDEHEAEGDDEDDDEEKAIRRFLISDLLIGRSVRRRITHRLLLSRMLRRGFLQRRRGQ